MTTTEYNQLSKLDQAMELSMNAGFVAEKADEQHSYSLYKLEDFYIETTVENANHKNSVYKAYNKEELPALWSDAQL